MKLRLVEEGAAQQMVDDALRVPPTAAPQLLNGWQDFGGTFAGAGYRRRSDGRVSLRGLVKGGSVGAAVFVLPEGFRPQADERFVSTGGGGSVALVFVRSSGAVEVGAGANNASVSLSGISFEASP